MGNSPFQYVLILVVVEDGLVLNVQVKSYFSHLVLILVVVEDGLVPYGSSRCW